MTAPPLTDDHPPSGKPDPNYVLWRRLERIESTLAEASTNIARLDARLGQIAEIKEQHKHIHDEVHTLQRDIGELGKTVSLNKLVSDAVKHVAAVVVAASVALMFSLWRANGGGGG